VKRFPVAVGLMAALMGPAPSAIAEDTTDDAIAGVGCVALIDAIYASNAELGQTAGGDQATVREEWLTVVKTLAPELGPQQFDEIYAEIYPGIYPIALEFGSEVVAGTHTDGTPSEAAETFLQMTTLCQEKMDQSLHSGME
jgi:hypothetical protein